MKKRKKKLGIGIIGLGKISSKHIDDSIKTVRELEIVAICDNREEVAREVAKREGVKHYKDYRDLISDKKVDVVSVLTPNYLHFEIGLQVARMKKHCIMEKPIAMNYIQAKKLVNAFKENGKLLFPVLQVRYNSPIQIAKTHVDKGLLGKILTAVLSIQWARPQEYYNESNWKGKKKRDGGSLLTQAIHYIDAMQYILGKAETVYGKVATVGHSIEVEDIANAIIDLKNGTRVGFDFTVCTYPHNLNCSLTILGTDGTIKIGGLAMNKIEIWEVKNTPNIFTVNGGYPAIPSNHKLVYQDLVNALVYKKKRFINAEDALESLRIIDAILKSSKENREIILR